VLPGERSAYGRLNPTAALVEDAVMTPGSEMFQDVPWPFPGDHFPDHLGAVVMRTVLDGQPALQVLHDPDNGWEVADGVGDPNEPGACVATHLRHVLDADPSLRDLATMPPGTLADRDAPGAEWVLRPFAW